MAGIQHANSIIADSITSASSPTRAIHEEQKDNDPLNAVDSEREPQIRPKRVGRTYGRSKPRLDEKDVADEDLVSRARILRTAPRDADDQVIPESDDTFIFPWKEKLRAIDEGLDDDPTTHQSEINPSRIAGDCDASNTRTELSGANETNDDLLGSVAPGDALLQPESLFDGSLSSLLSEPTPNSRQPLENDGPMEALPEQNLKRATDSANGSDSEHASPQHPYPINSPARRSSSTVTPPTSPFGELGSQETLDQSGLSTMATKKGSSNKGKGKEPKTKGLTKKEIIEMKKESARLLAGRHVSIERAHSRSTHTIASLFNKLKPLPTSSKSDSDPIVPFSSPAITLRQNSHHSSERESSSKSTRFIPSPSCSKSKSATIHLRENTSSQDESKERNRDEESEDEMPDAKAIFREHTEKQLRKEEKGRAREKWRASDLEELKRKALEAVRHTKAGETVPPRGSDTDDDLEVEIMVRPETKNSEMRSGVQKTIPRPNYVSHNDLLEAAKPAFISRKGRSRQRGQPTSVSQKELNDLLLQRVDRQGGAIEEKKKEQWVKSGGVLKEHRRPETEEKLVIDWLEKGAARETMEDGEGEEDGDDPEYEQSDIEGQESEASDLEAGDPGPPDDEASFRQRMDTSDEGSDADKENHRPAPRRQRARAIVGSDEDEPMSQSRPRSHTVLVPDTSFGEHSDNSSGGDKENSAELAFSFDENKENAGVPRHPERGRVIDADEPHTNEVASALSPVSHVVGNSKRGREPLSRLDAETTLAFVPGAVTQRRDGSLDRVLQVLHEEDKDATLAPIGSPRKGDLDRGSSTPSDFEILDGPTLISPIGFSQLFGGHHSEEPVPDTVLPAGGFSQFFSQGSDNGDSSFVTPIKPQHRPVQAKPDNFEFTQPNALLPSIKISESQRREVDAMFGKDQEFKLDEAKKSKGLSQDPGSSGSDTLPFGSFVPSPIGKTPRTIRRPLETLALEGRSEDALFDDLESPQTQPTRRSRLLRGPRERSSSSPSPPLVPRNAFDVLRDAASKSKREREAKKDIGKSEFIEVEAEESDEEAMLGFGGAKRNDDDEGGSEDPNMVVEGLVDDRVLDDATQAADLVLEKHLEHQAVDDAALEKLHQDAVDGKLRGKRRDRGIRFDDSSDTDTDDADVGRPHKQLAKKRRLDSDALEACGNDPATAPFYDAYRVALADDFLTIGQDDSTSPREQETQDDSDDDSPEVVDPIKVRRQIIDEKFNQGLRSGSPELDPENASWVDSDDEDIDMDGVRVEDRPLHPREVTRSAHSKLEHVGYRGGFEGKKTGPNEERQLKTWASQESRAHTSATGRGGFSRKDGGGSSSSRKHAKLAPMKDSTRNEGKVVKHSSLISHVEKRKGFNS